MFKRFIQHKGEEPVEEESHEVAQGFGEVGQDDAAKDEPMETEYLKEEIMADMNNQKNMLSNDVEIKGSLKFANALIIDGKIEGEITSDGDLTVGENAEIEGEIKTKSVTVLGRVNGNITVEERAELKSKAQLIGDLKAGRLVIEEGATFVGKSEVTPNKVNMPKPEVVRDTKGADSKTESDKIASFGGGR